MHGLATTFFTVCSDTPASAITTIVSTSTVTTTVTTGSDAHAQEDCTTLIGSYCSNIIAH